MTEKFQIRAVYDDTSIRVYQAYNDTIADEALRLGKFGSHFRMSRMTWIKPSFLWMMYRCGWAEKADQERVLAIDIKRSGFDKAVKSAVLSTYKAESGISMAKWQKLVKESDVRIQWDPEKDVDGNDLDYRSIQLGLRGQAVCDYVNDWIIGINDVTGYVKELNSLRKSGADISCKLPDEKVYRISGYDAMAENVSVRH